VVLVKWRGKCCHIGRVDKVNKAKIGEKIKMTMNKIKVKIAMRRRWKNEFSVISLFGGRKIIAILTFLS
jgi:hypothetical protein